MRCLPCMQRLDCDDTGSCPCTCHEPPEDEDDMYEFYYRTDD